MEEVIRLKKYKICILAGALEFRGLTIYTYFLVKGLIEAGHKVLLLCQDGSLNETLKKLDVQILFYKKWKNLFEKEIFCKRVSSVLKEEEVDLINTVRPDCFRLGNKIARLSGLNNIMTIPFPLNKKEPALLDERCKGVIALSNNVKESLINVCGVNKKVIQLIGSGVDLEDFDTYNRWDGFKDVIVIAGIGWFDKDITSQKYFLETIKIMEGLDEFKEYNLEYALIGEGPDEERYRRLASEYKITERVHFLVETTDFFGTLSQVDIFVIPYQMTGIGLTMIYVLASGRPVIVFGTGGVYDVVKHNEIGYIVEKGDVHGIISAISEFLKNPDRAKELATNGRKFVVENFNLANTINEILQVYDNAVK